MEETTEYGKRGHIDPVRADFAKAALQGLLANKDWVNGKTRAARTETDSEIIV